jgi:hypothetical protein
MPEGNSSGKQRGGAAVMLPVGGKRIFRKAEWRARTLQNSARSEKHARCR